MQNLPFAQLEAFLAVARHHNFSAAARELQVSRSAVSQAIRQLEEELRVTLVSRTTRSVSLTEAGKQLAEKIAPAFAQTAAVLAEMSADPQKPVGTLRLSVPRVAVPLLIEPILPVFCSRFPRISLEIVVEDRLVDIVAEGFDAGIRDEEIIEKDMVAIRLSEALRYIIVASPAYLKQHGTPQHPEDILDHHCLRFRSPTTDAIYAWELERGDKKWRIPVRGSLTTNDSLLCAAWAKQGLGLAYTIESHVSAELADGSLQCVLPAYAPSTAGFFLYFPSRAQQSRALQLFVATAKEVLRR